MKPTSSDFESVNALRQRAEQAVQKAAPSKESAEHDRMRYELHVHEMELRMQNDALRELQVEASLARDKYRELFEHAPLAYLVLDSSSQIIEANVAASSLLDQERDALVGQKLSTFIDDLHVDRFARHMRATLGEGMTHSCELSAVVGDAVLRDIRIESVRDRRDPSRWRAALTDVTEVRQMQRQLERSQRLEAIGTFASGIAHDFANVLAVVSGGATLALDLRGTPEDSPVPLERIKRAAHQGKTMVQQLLRFASGPESDGTAIYEIDAAVLDAEPIVRQFIGKKIELELDLRATGCKVCVDLGGPEEILVNLAANAQHAMPDGGMLRIETRVVNTNVGLVRRLPEQTYVLLSVTDTGAGMDLATQARAFEPFFTTKSGGKGHGLGLAMVYGIVKRAGGHLQLTSELRKGTTFCIYIPLASDDEVP